MNNLLHQVPSREAQPGPVALFVSDIHLQASMPRTAAAFLDFLHRRATKAQCLYLLGDVFEYWAGDDDIASPFNQQIVQALRKVSEAGVALFWIPGNRDFLAGEKFAAASGASLLQEPYAALVAGRRIVLAHGDAQCTDDHAYMAFRAQVRQPEWQQSFLAMPLEKRKEIIAGLRDDSREAQKTKPCNIMDVNRAAILSLFDASGADTMIHGHTHRPGYHAYEEGQKHYLRYVLPDWDCDTQPPRGGWIAITTDGAIRCFDIGEQEPA